jgi:N utilization substance protein B
LAVYELLYRDDIPPKVTINEAVDLGKKFGTEESGAFINGILDKIYSTLNLDGFVKSRKTPSPSMGEGWGEGE